jgi:hypothetical protein
LIGEASPLLSLAQRTFVHRPARNASTWSFDAIQAARLGMGTEVAAALIDNTQKTQHFVNGMAKWEETSKEFYVEETGVVADALQEALVQDYDGTIRVAPAIPPGWDFDGSVFVRGKTKVDVQTRNGVVTTLVIEAGMTQRFRVRNPWPGEAVDVSSGHAGIKLAHSVKGQVIEFTGTAGTNYLIEKHDRPASSRPFVFVAGTPASAPTKLGLVQLGLFRGDKRQ